MSSPVNEHIAIKEPDFMTTAPSYDFTDPKTAHDCILVVEGIKFHVQSGLLSLWSEFFKGLFASEFEESKGKEIVINEVYREDFEEFLKFIYPSNTKVSEDNVIALVEMSHRFLAPGVMVDCKDFIQEHFDKIDILDLLEVSIKYGFTDTKEKIGDIIFASPAKPSGYCRCSCKYDLFDSNCKNNHTHVSSEIIVNRFIKKNAKRISKLSREAQSYILQASVGNIDYEESDANKSESDEEEDEQSSFDEEEIVSEDTDGGLDSP